MPLVQASRHLPGSSIPCIRTLCSPQHLVSRIFWVIYMDFTPLLSGWLPASTALLVLPSLCSCRFTPIPVAVWGAEPPPSCKLAWPKHPRAAVAV